jgi:hypothetical protein
MVMKIDVLAQIWGRGAVESKLLCAGAARGKTPILSPSEGSKISHHEAREGQQTRMKEWVDPTKSRRRMTKGPNALYKPRGQAALSTLLLLLLS